MNLLLRFALSSFVATLILVGCGGGGDAGGGNSPTAIKYKISGTVSGLAPGTSISLMNNSGDLITLNSNSTFQFPTQLVQGSQYNVTVSSQPNGQTCAVILGTGSVASSDIRDILVSCRANLAIGGTISGLLPGNSVILLNNDADPLTLRSNSTFNFSTRIPFTALYKVTVGTQPSGQICAVSAPSGNATADVDNITVQCVSMSILWNFGGTTDDGQTPNGLIQARDGNFYGTTTGGGPDGRGTAFKITPSGRRTILWQFGFGNDGIAPSAAMVEGSDGNFYGTTTAGGAYGYGTVFKLTPSGVETVLWSFGSTSGDGRNPLAALIQARDGDFYGTTENGGTADWGTVFKITPNGSETVLWSFSSTDIADAKNPWAALTQGSDGNFYGTSFGGGLAAWGTVFTITPAGVESVLVSFIPYSNNGYSSGVTPVAALTEGRDGAFYGTTAIGDSNVFSVTPAGELHEVWVFGGDRALDRSDGTRPETQLIIGTDGYFYGTTSMGGAFQRGTVYKITQPHHENVVWSFGSIANDGAVPSGLIQGRDGNLYGTTKGGGVYDNGTLFKITL